MSSPLNRIFPESDGSSALITLTSEVLPAPLGPTNETNSRSAMLRLTLSTARVSPKYFFRLMVLRRFMSPPLSEFAKLARKRSDDTCRQRQYQHHKHSTEHELPIGGTGDGVNLKIIEHDCADDRPGEGAKAAKHRHEHDLAGERPIQNIGRDQAVQRHPQNTGKTGEAARQQKCDPTITSNGNAQELRAGLVVAYRL